jgi:hypothetical protein
MDKVLKTAIQQSFDFSQMVSEEEKADKEDNSASLPAAMTRDRRTEVREQFRSKAEAIRLPVFELTRKRGNGIFSDGNEGDAENVKSKLELENLYEGFNLDSCSHEIELNTSSIEVRRRFLAA